MCTHRYVRYTQVQIKFVVGVKIHREEEEAEEAGAEGTETDGDGWEEAGSVWIDLKVK